MSEIKALMVTADDFGRSDTVNRAVVLAHQTGFLTAASWMPTGDAAQQAIECAKGLPTLGIGLHLTLIRGKPCCSPSKVKDLLPDGKQFDKNPVRAGLRYFFRRDLRPQLRWEIRAQLEAFLSTGIILDHVNGHLHMHVHPVVLSILLEELKAYRLSPAIRLPNEKLLFNLCIGQPGRWFYRVSHAVIFSMLSTWAKSLLKRNGIRFAKHVFGLLESGRITEEYCIRLVRQLPTGTSELYSHPDVQAAPHELAALTSQSVRYEIEKAKVRLIRGIEL